MSVSSGTKNLFWNIKNGSKEDILKILQEEKEIDLNELDEHGKTVLALPFGNENLTEEDVIDVLEFFLDRGVDVDIENDDGKTALVEAVASLKKKVVDLLIRRQANFNKICQRGNNITNYLVKSWYSEYDAVFPTKSDDELKIMEKESATLVEWLIANGLDFDSPGATGLSQSLTFNLHPISLAILNHTKNEKFTNIGIDNLLHHFWSVNGLLRKTYHKIQAEKWRNFNNRYASKIVKILVDKEVSALALGTYRKTPLRMALEKGESLEVIDVLLDHLVWSNKHQRSDEATAVLIELFSASKRWGDESRTIHFLKVARALIAEGADVNGKNSFGKTAVYYAFRGRNRCAIDLLDENGVDFGILYSRHRNLYHILAEFRNSINAGQQEALFDLIATKPCCDVNAKDSEERTPLHYVAKTTNLTIARKLIERKADVNAKDSDESTPLHFAVDLHKVSRRDYKLVELLLTNKAEVNFKNRSGKRPLTCVTSFTSRRSVQLLLQWGALVNDQLDGEPIYLTFFRSKGFDCLEEMLAYGLNINDERLQQFFELQVQHHPNLQEFFSKYLMKHETANLTCSNFYEQIVNDVEFDEQYYLTCWRDLAKLKSTFIDSLGTSLYDYLHMDVDSRVIHNKNKWLQEFVARPDFTEYSVLILARYHTALKWKTLFEPAKETWLRLTHIALPDICIERIFAQLSIGDLVVLVEDAST